MTKDQQKVIVLVIRVLVAAVFVLSAVAKLYPAPALGIMTFERDYLGEVGLHGSLAKVMSRLLIGLEFSIAIFLLLPFYLKKIVFPVTIGILTIFSIHLAMQVFGGDASNCGCFGELIPMTPLQALIKNILTIGLLVFPLLRLKDGFPERNNFSPLLIIGLAISLLMFILIPQGSGGVTNEGGETVSAETEFTKYFDDINEGNKLLCFFSPTCEHCMETGKKLTELKQKYPGLMPEIRILFMDESDNGSAEEVKAYFEFIGAEYPYKVLTVDEYLPIFFMDYNFPGVRYLYNGQERIFFEGIEGNEFNADKLLEEIKREY